MLFLAFQYFQNVLINKNIMFLFLDSFASHSKYFQVYGNILHIPSLSTQQNFYLCLHDGLRFPSSPNALQFSHFERKTIQIKRNGEREREKSKTNFQGLENWNRQTFRHKIELERVLCLLCIEHCVPATSVQKRTTVY